MSQKSIALIVSLFVLIVAGMFVYAYLKQSELQQPAPASPAAPAPDQVVPYPDITRIDATHYFIDGTHTLVGEIPFPTPCDLLETEALVLESYPEQVHVHFSVINNAETCTEVVTPQRFSVSFTASEAATISAHFMDREVVLNLRPAPDGETPDQFELFIKG